MHLVHKSFLIATLALTFVLVDVPTTKAANPNSSWGWAKPLNQRQGLLYTTNRAFKRGSTSSRTRSVWTPSRPQRSVQTSRSSVQPPLFLPGRSGRIPFNRVGRY